MMASGRFKDRAALDGLVKELETTASVSAAGLHFTAINPGGLKLVMGSSASGETPWSLEALATQLASYPRLDALARWVARGLAGGGGISTQDAAFGLWSLAAYLKTTSGKTDLFARAVLGQEELARSEVYQPRRSAQKRGVVHQEPGTGPEPQPFSFGDRPGQPVSGPAA